MNESRRTVLLGDHNPSRLQWLKRILENYFEVEIETAPSVEELSVCLGSALNENRLVSVFLVDDLPINETTQDNRREKVNRKKVNKLHNALLSDLFDKNPGIQVCLVHFPDSRANIALEHSQLSRLQVSNLQLKKTTGSEEIEPILAQAEKLISRKRERGLPILDWNKEDWTLRGQIRALDMKRIQSEGELILQWLIYRSKSLDWKQATIKSMGQGKSGACVFLVSHEVNGLHERFILKLCDDGDGGKGSLRKLEHEIKGSLLAQETLIREGVIQHLPDLIPPRVTDFPNHEYKKYMARYKSWYAICYPFLGGERFGPILDLASVLTNHSKQLLQQTEKSEIRNRLGNIRKNDESLSRALRIKILDFILDWLRRYWYENNVSEKMGSPEIEIWDFDGSRRDKFDAKPPYWLSQKTKEMIFQFLSSREADLGDRFFPNDWNAVSRNVREFVEREEGWTPPKRLNRPIQVTLSPAHGDLNANNILFWPEEVHAFLIDFPFFQQNGHVMQDLAQLECEIKFSLMDRQEGVEFKKLMAYDYTYSQIAVWKAVEDYLCSEKEWHEKGVNWPWKGYRINAELTLEMVKKIRDCAIGVRKAHGLKTNVVDFHDEYFPALLYHTLRNIGYDSLSVFKRLLAVYSAGKLIVTLS